MKKSVLLVNIELFDVANSLLTQMAPVEYKKTEANRDAALLASLSLRVTSSISRLSLELSERRLDTSDAC